MLHYQISFASPWYLALLALLAVIWWYGFRRLAALGRSRRLLVLLLRSLVVALLVLALAEIQAVRISQRLTVVFLLDQSLSIPPERRKAMIELVNAEISKHRRGDDRAGAIVFGREAAIEMPPFDDPDLRLSVVVESPLDPEYTNLAGAMKLAQASFPEDAAKRIVILSDGNENIGSALQQAQGLADAGIGIDVVPVHYHHRAEVVMERITLPDDVRLNEPFDLKVVVNNLAEPTAGDAGSARGRVVVSQVTDGQPEVLSDQPVTLPPGKKVFTIRQRLKAANFYTYEARFIPAGPEDDTMPQNNRATAFTHVRGKGQVLLVEDHENPGEFNVLVERLRRQELEVAVRPSNQLFTSLAELQQFDTVLLANVPREHFTEDQIEMLVRNTQQMGAGLAMLGGPNSFGAGGWTNSELEKAMPIDFEIKSAKVVPRGALVMLMHASEIPEGNHWQKVVAHKAIEALGPHDYCGLLHWNGVEQWLWGRGLLPVGENRNRMMAAVDRMTPGDMPDFEPGMRLAQQGFSRVGETAIRHMVIISDGDPSAPSSGAINALIAMNVTISTVAVGAHGPAESQRLAAIAQQTGGKYYAVNNAKALPQIFQREARRVARPLIWDKFPVQPQIKYPHEILGGIGESLPPIKGFVLTSKKNNPLVETLLVSPQPVGEENSTLLAAWTYGLGKSVAFTTDAGARWTTEWTKDALYDKFFGQMVRWTMRPAGDSGKFTTSSEIADGQVRMVVTALDKNDEFMNFLNMTATAVGPDLKPVPFTMEQTAPGRYVGRFSARDAGSYFLMLSPGPGMAPIRTGINVPYSDEFRDRAANDTLLGQLAATVPKGGAAGQVIEAFADTDNKNSPRPRTDAARVGEGQQPSSPRPLGEGPGVRAVDPFRHDLLKATSTQDIWHYMVFLGSCLFFFDVFFRRVQISFTWLPPLAGRARDWVLRRQTQGAEPVYLERLRSRKAQVADRLEQARAAARFEPPSALPPDLQVPPSLGEVTAAPEPAEPAAPSLGQEEKKEDESYTERLLRAKKKVWKDREK
jgi:uncharacterized membrane protein